MKGAVSWLFSGQPPVLSLSGKMWFSCVFASCWTARVPDDKGFRLRSLSLSKHSTSLASVSGQLSDTRNFLIFRFDTRINNLTVLNNDD